MDSDRCCALCEEEAECEGFTFFDHACYLKKDFVGTYTTVGAVSRVKKVEQCAGFEAAQEDADLAGRDLEDWEAPAAEVCCRACGRKPECQGFAFSDSRCYLKADVTHTYNQTGVVVHVKEGVFSTTPAPTCSADFEVAPRSRSCRPRSRSSPNPVSIARSVKAMASQRPWQPLASQIRRTTHRTRAPSSACAIGQRVASQMLM